MRLTYIVLKKEMKNFQVRKSMVKWYFTLIFMNILFLFLPRTESVPITLNRPFLSMILMMFSCFLVPNNLSIDTIGGEKYHRTAETLFTTPLNIREIFAGKTIFILILGVLSLVLTTVLNNVLLMIIYRTSYLDCGLSAIGIISAYCIAILSIALIAFIGSGTSLVSNNLKINGYLVAVVNFILVYTIYKVLLENSIGKIIFLILLLFLLCLAFFWIITMSIEKKHVMKYIK